MKQSGKSIQSKSLNCVLGDLDTLHVQPYEKFVKEEQKKLKEYWLVAYFWTHFILWAQKCLISCPQNMIWFYVGCNWQTKIFL